MFILITYLCYYLVKQSNRYTKEAHSYTRVGSSQRADGNAMIHVSSLPTGFVQGQIQYLGFVVT